MRRSTSLLSCLLLGGCTLEALPGGGEEAPSASDQSDAQVSPSLDDSGDEPEQRWVEPLSTTTFHVGFNLVNPLVGGYGACFGANLNQLVHAAEDRGVAAGTPVVAIGRGRVIYSAITNYPGGVVVVRHELSADQRAAVQAATGVEVEFITSQYAHLGSLAVDVGDSVESGQVLATVLDQGGNSHLHWEVRTFEMAPICGGSVPGPGYTAPGTDARDFGYLDPSRVVEVLDSSS